MAYIDYKYYTEGFKGKIIPEDQFGALAERASDIIDIVTNFKLSEIDINSLPPMFIKCIKKATAAQTEYIFSKGGTSAINGGGEDSLSSVNIGSFSYQEDSSQTKLTRDQKMLSPLVLQYLNPTGLFYSGVDVYSHNSWGCIFKC